MDILHTFGIDPFLTIASIVNFLIILYILRRFLYKPLFKIFEKREQLVKESVKNAEQTKKSLEKARIEEKEIIKKAQATANQILKDAREQSVLTIRQAEDEAKKQTQRMVQEARSQIEQETAQAQDKLNKYVAKLSVDLLKKSLANIFTDDEQNEIVSKALKEMQKKPN
jgi:F-type H+-transporting ATPase subunit b